MKATGKVLGYKLARGGDDAHVSVSIPVELVDGVQLGDDVVVLSGQALEAVRVAVAAMRSQSAGNMRRAATASRALGGVL